MVEDRIGYRYAKSLFDLAETQGSLEAVRQDMEMISTTGKQNADFRAFLSSPLINAFKKATVLEALFGGQYASTLTRDLVQMLARKSRERYLTQVAAAFLFLYDEKNQIHRGVLTSAVPLTQETADAIISVMGKTTGGRVEVEQRVDPSLIGGFVLKIGDQLFDGSVAASLRRMKQALSQRTV
ncbi:MAG: ATP synthase F1 subunit delta [Bacteroidia bacterium]|nr:ATP synthase F1 subunit delta [Bacteroidia bacterium]